MTVAAPICIYHQKHLVVAHPFTQVVTFVEVFLRSTQARCVVIITPVNTIGNWHAEFEKWYGYPGLTYPWMTFSLRLAFAYSLTCAVACLQPF